MLRIAESLDRSHGQVIAQVELQPTGSRFRLVLRAHGPAELERWAASRHAVPLEKLVGKGLTFQAEDLDHAEYADSPLPVRRTASRRRGSRPPGQGRTARRP
jgi:hypothetical protein